MMKKIKDNENIKIDIHEFKVKKKEILIKYYNKDNISTINLYYRIEKFFVEISRNNCSNFVG